MKPIILFHFSRLYRAQNNFGPLNNHIITEFTWVVTVVTGQPWHFAVTCNVTVAIAKTIVIAGYLPYQIIPSIDGPVHHLM